MDQPSPKRQYVVSLGERELEVVIAALQAYDSPSHLEYAHERAQAIFEAIKS